jgi:hypothetical protein
MFENFSKLVKILTREVELDKGGPPKITPPLCIARLPKIPPEGLLHKQK